MANKGFWQSNMSVLDVLNILLVACVLAVAICASVLLYRRLSRLSATAGQTDLYRLALEEGPALLLVQDASHRTIKITPTLCALLEMSQDTCLGQDFFDNLSSESRARLDLVRAQGGWSRPSPELTLEFKTETGLSKKLSASLQVVNPQAVDDQPKFVFLFRDLTELEAHKSLTETLLNRNAAIVLSQDKSWKIQSVSDAWTEEFGYSRDETLGMDLVDFMAPDEKEESVAFRETHLRHLGGADRVTTTRTLMTKWGEPRIVELRAFIEENDARWLNIVMIVDVTETVMAKRDLERLVVEDDLTGLVSRRGFHMQFSDGLRTRDYDLYLLDIDHFKSVNDAYGHEAGDLLLANIADEIRKFLGEAGIACRIGGEEFAILVTATGRVPSARFARNLNRTVAAATISSTAGQLSRTASIGAVRLARDGKLNDVFSWADLALREAKENGRDHIVVVDACFKRRIEEDGKLTTHRDVAVALKKGEISKFVQPILDARAGQICGFEALIRWTRADGTIVPPRKFIDQYQNVIQGEEFADAPRDLNTALLKKLKAHPSAFVSFNTRLEALAFEGAAQALIRNFGVNVAHGRQILLEISEASMHSRLDMKQVAREIDALRREGVRIALDDFGLEASNLNRLTQLPIDVVKIDQSLVQRIVEDLRSRETLRAVAQLAESLAFDLIAEGVETPEQRDVLLEMGINLHQGFLYSAPHSVAEANADGAARAYLMSLEEPPKTQCAKVSA